MPQQNTRKLEFIARVRKRTPPLAEIKLARNNEINFKYNYIKLYKKCFRNIEYSINGDGLTLITMREHGLYLYYITIH